MKEKKSVVNKVYDVTPEGVKYTTHYFIQFTEGTKQDAMNTMSKIRNNKDYVINIPCLYDIDENDTRTWISSFCKFSGPIEGTPKLTVDEAVEMFKEHYFVRCGSGYISVSYIEKSPKDKFCKEISYKFLSEHYDGELSSVTKSFDNCIIYDVVNCGVSYIVPRMLLEYMIKTIINNFNDGDDDSLENAKKLYRLMWKKLRDTNKYE